MKKVRTEDQMSFYMRFHSADIYRALLEACDRSQQPMREIVERACRFALTSKEFKIPRRQTTADKMAAARARRIERLRQKSAEPELALDAEVVTGGILEDEPKP